LGHPICLEIKWKPLWFVEGSEIFYHDEKGSNVLENITRGFSMTANVI